MAVVPLRKGNPAYRDDLSFFCFWSLENKGVGKVNTWNVSLYISLSEDTDLCILVRIEWMFINPQWGNCNVPAAAYIAENEKTLKKYKE